MHHVFLCPHMTPRVMTDQWKHWLQQVNAASPGTLQHVKHVHVEGDLFLQNTAQINILCMLRTSPEIIGGGLTSLASFFWGIGGWKLWEPLHENIKVIHHRSKWNQSLSYSSQISGSGWKWKISNAQQFLAVKDYICIERSFNRSQEPVCINCACGGKTCSQF